MPDTCETCRWFCMLDTIAWEGQCESGESPFYGQSVSADFCCPWRKAKEDTCEPSSLSSSAS